MRDTGYVDSDIDGSNLCCKVCNYDNCRYKRREMKTDSLCMQPESTTVTDRSWI